MPVYLNCWHDRHFRGLFVILLSEKYWEKKSEAKCLLSILFVGTVGTEYQCKASCSNNFSGVHVTSTWVSSKHNSDSGFQGIYSVIYLHKQIVKQNWKREGSIQTLRLREKTTRKLLKHIKLEGKQQCKETGEMNRKEQKKGDCVTPCCFSGSVFLVIILNDVRDDKLQCSIAVLWPQHLQMHFQLASPTEQYISIDLFPPLTLNLTHNDLRPYFHTNFFLIRGDKYRIDITNSLCIASMHCFV